MKLLTRTNIYYIISSFIAFILGGIIFYHYVEKIFYSQIDETLTTEKLLILEQINYNDNLPDFRTVFGHSIQVSVVYVTFKKSERIGDTLMYDPDYGAFRSFRHLKAKGTSLRGRGYLINLYILLDETETLITSIIILMGILFVILMSILIFVNYFIMRRAWFPFYRTLILLDKYDISSQKQLSFPKTRIREFEMLNKTLQKMSEKISQDYQNLKEFNENASHELQTPLAIIKSKLELLLQDEKLKEGQVKHINTVYEAATRMSKLNQGLLLISKIDNNQFSQAEEIDMTQEIKNYTEHFQEILGIKEITVSTELPGHPVKVHMNRILADVLNANIFGNAIKHNYPGGKIKIILTDKYVQFLNTGLRPTVPPQTLFERFKKSDRTADSIGLGLSIAKKITDYYGFQIEYSYEKDLHMITIQFKK
jgi:signal transduction histidine kinase